jgi:hypothetical protein
MCPTVTHSDDEILLRRAAARATGDWLYAHVWEFFASLSFRVPVSERDAGRLFEKVWIRRLDWHARRATAWARITTGGDTSTRIHVHALIDARGHVSGDLLQSAWEFGNSRILRYDRSKGAAFYIGRHLRDSTALLTLSSCRWRPGSQ